jgi:retron-type reverse transcriptase
MIPGDELLTDLFRAYFDARRHKRNTLNQLRFEIDYEKNLMSLYRAIADREYCTGPSVCFIVDRPVKREIFAADFRDRVVHHLIYNYMIPVLETVFIDDSYSCRRGKGTLYGIRRVESFIRECSGNYTQDCYILKLDIRGYFMSIDRRLLRDSLTSLINEADGNSISVNPFGVDSGLLLYLIGKVLDDDPRENCLIKSTAEDWHGLPPTKSLFHAREHCGLPIGNLTSQLFSNVYLHPLDCFVKERLGIRYYGRYVDDFILIHRDRQVLKEAIGQIRQFLSDRLRMELHPGKIYLQHYSKGVDFLGATLKPYRSYVSNRAKRNFSGFVNRWNRILSGKEPSKDDLVRLRSGINSYLGIMCHHRTFNIRRKILLEGDGFFFRYGYLTNGLRRFVLKKKRDNPE